MRQPKTPNPVICLLCGKRKEGGYHRGKYCSFDCKMKYDAIHVKERFSNASNQEIDTCKRGAISELIVCADLLGQGYEVFRAVSASASCDVIVLKNGKMIRVEVRTGRMDQNGVLSYTRKSRDVTRHELYAVVYSGKVTYVPNISEFF